MNLNPNSELCQNLLNPQYRRLYVNFARLKQNRKWRRKMLKLAREAEKTSMEKMYNGR